MADRKGGHSKRKNSSSSVVWSGRVRETPYQDINRIRRNILAIRETKGTLSAEDYFVDPSFASDITSLAYVYSGDDKYERAIFKRPQEVQSECVLVGVGGVCDEPFPWRHWKQRQWFHAALVVVSLSVRHLERIIPGYKNLEQGFGQDYTGAFHFNIWRFGEWVDVVVDDRLPMLDDRHLFCSPMGSAQELWGPLVEKAYAKCKKTYQSIEYGRTLDALTDLTGSVCEHFTPDVRPPRNLFRVLIKSHLARSLMVCWRNDKRLTSTGFSPDSELQESQNLRYLHVITAVTKFPLTDGRLVEMLRMKCPFTGEPGWQGRFSDRDFAAWESVNRDFLQRLQPLTKKDEDEYWISMDDFRCNFGGLFIVSSVEPFRVDGLSLTRSYHLQPSVETVDSCPAFMASDVGLGYGLQRRGSTPKPHNTGGRLLDPDTLQPDMFHKSPVLDTVMTSDSLPSPSSPTETSCGAAILDQGFKKGFFFRSSSHQHQKKSRRKSVDLQRLAHAQSEAQRTKAVASKTVSSPVSTGTTVDSESGDVRDRRHPSPPGVDSFTGGASVSGRSPKVALSSLATRDKSHGKQSVTSSATSSTSSATSSLPKSPRQPLSHTAATAGEKSLAIASAPMLPKSPRRAVQAKCAAVGDEGVQTAPGSTPPKSPRHAPSVTASGQKLLGVTSSATAARSPKLYVKTTVIGEKSLTIASSPTPARSPKHGVSVGGVTSVTPRASPTTVRSQSTETRDKNGVKLKDARATQKVPIPSARRQLAGLSPGPPPKSPRRMFDSGGRGQSDVSAARSTDDAPASLTEDKESKSFAPSTTPGHVIPAWASVEGDSVGDLAPLSPRPASEAVTDGLTPHTPNTPLSTASSPPAPSDIQFMEENHSASSATRDLNSARNVFRFPDSAKTAMSGVDDLEASDSFDEDFHSLHKPARQTKRAVRSLSSASDTDSTHSASDIFLHFKTALTSTISSGSEARTTVSRERGYDSEREEEGVGCFRMVTTTDDKRPHSAPHTDLVRHTSSTSLSSLTQGHFRATKADYFRSDGRWILVLDTHDKWTRSKPCSGRSSLDLHSRSQRHHFHIARREYPDEVSPPTLQGKRHVLVSLMQDYRHGAPTANSLLVPIGFCLYKSKGGERDERRHISKFQLIDQIQGEPEVREVNARFDLDPGSYFLVPFFLSESHEGEYLLRVLTEECPHTKAG
ncbi:hypothetical protein BaRGS_00013583, partial [Batillaria attramentaria]